MSRGSARLLALLCLLVPYLSCTSRGSEELEGSTLVRCTEPRPQICTRDYRPACGVREDDSVDTYGNVCDACADERVVGHRPGECPAE
jgi:hypothetical protein